MGAVAVVIAVAFLAPVRSRAGPSAVKAAPQRRLDSAVHRMASTTCREWDYRTITHWTTKVLERRRFLPTRKPRSLKRKKMDPES